MTSSEVGMAQNQAKQKSRTLKMQLEELEYLRTFCISVITNVVYLLVFMM